jgi:hypothetical protein
MAGADFRQPLCVCSARGRLPGSRRRRGRLGTRNLLEAKLDALHLEANYVRRSDAELLWKQK